MQLEYGPITTKKNCPIMAQKDIMPYCVQDRCALWDSRRGCCGLKQSPLPKCLMAVPK
jgi:hypothetical protein